MPFQDKAQQARLLTLLDKLDKSSTQFDLSVCELSAAVTKTPDQVADLIDMRMKERASISDALKGVQKANIQLAQTVNGHAQVVQNLSIYILWKV